MNEEDRKIVNRLKSSVEREKKEPTGGVGYYFLEEKVLPLIDRLDDERIKQHDTIMNYRDEVEHLKKQLTEIKEAGEPFTKTYKYCMLLDNEVVGCIINERFEALEQERGESLYGKHFRRLAEALKGVDHE